VPDRLVIAIPEPFPDTALDAVDDRFELRQGRAGAGHTEDELIRFLEGADAAAIYSRDRYTRRVFAALPRLRVLAKGGSKPTSNVDLDAAKEHDVQVSWTPGANAVSVAEMAIVLMLTVLRRFPELTRRLQEGGWRDFDLLGHEMAGRTLGLVGFGVIGREVAKRYRAFGGPVIAFDPRFDASAAENLGVRQGSLEDVLTVADIVSLHCEMNAATAGLIGQARVQQMKPGAVFINTARGGLVDEEALLRALDGGRISAAALDVFSVEPVPAGNALANHPKVIATPHVSAFTHEAIHRESRWALEDAGRLLLGLPALHGA